MSFTSYMAEQRFGYGRSASVAAPVDVAAMLALLEGPDRALQKFPLLSFRSLQDAQVLRRRFDSFARKNPNTTEGEQARKKANEIRSNMRRDQNRWFAQIQMRRIATKDGFRERLVAFWADHFTALGKNGLLRLATPLYIDEAVRPHINGTFGDLLTACVTHPLMLHYLDQSTSAGPNSNMAKRRRRIRGLNENLAREVLELHTLGVDAPYGQKDVRELAKLFTGLALTRDYSLKFRSNMAEPGAETVLDKTYASKASLASIHEALQDLARHPATAAHIARKLVVHFVSDTPPEDLINHVTAAYQQSDGALGACYAALLEHPATWLTPATNIRPPDEFVSAAMRAIGATQEKLTALKPKGFREVFFQPLRLMGQPWLAPSGPDGFPEEDGAWVTPQGISARLEWAMNAPAKLVNTLPDPREFVRDALGDDAPPAVVFAANSAEERKVAIGLILASPAFQRR